MILKSRWGVGGEESKTQFAVVLFVGMIVHSLFAEVLNRAPGLILANVNYVKKVVFPLESVGKRLGEILVEQGLVAQKHINRVLRKQKRMRMLALAVTVLVAPFQMARADDLSPSHDLYTATQQELIKTFEAQVTLGGNGGNEDAGDIAKVIQTGGEANLAIILQSGNHDIANILQTGGIQNAALISQHGNDQIASISQSGNHNLALIAQR